ncbi:hypothetical protein O9992_16935 [Vibrio lentus]|nr:hypothetical protein [Vibrio lentus]
MAKTTRNSALIGRNSTPAPTAVPNSDKQLRVKIFIVKLAFESLTAFAEEVVVFMLNYSFLGTGNKLANSAEFSSAKIDSNHVMKRRVT